MGTPWRKNFRRWISSSHRDFRDLPALLSRPPETKTLVSKPTFLYDEKTPRILSTPSFTAYVKIARVAPSPARSAPCRASGTYRSRRVRSVTEEAKRLAAQGVQELILIAQDTTAYGEDLRTERPWKNFSGVCQGGRGSVDSTPLFVPKARYFTEGLLDLMVHQKKICSYLDLPIQHIDDEILKRMDAGPGVLKSETSSIRSGRSFLKSVCAHR